MFRVVPTGAAIAMAVHLSTPVAVPHVTTSGVPRYSTVTAPDVTAEAMPGKTGPAGFFAGLIAVDYGPSTLGGLAA